MVRSMSFREPAAILLLCCLGGAACTLTEQVVGFDPSSTDGSTALPVVGPGVPFGAPVLIEGLLDSSYSLADPALSADLLEIYFSSNKSDLQQIWTSTRAAVGKPWKPAVLVTDLSTSGMDVEPWLSHDGLTIWFASHRSGGHNAGGFEIYVAHRSPNGPWSVPSQVYLGTATTDRKPSVDVNGLNLAFWSERGSAEDLYLAARSSPAADWAAPIILSELNSPNDDLDPGLYHNGLGLMFASNRSGDHSNIELYESARPSSGSPFAAPVTRVELNSPQNEGDPWLSDDGHYLVFTSLRSGASRLYEAWR